MREYDNDVGVGRSAADAPSLCPIVGPLPSAFVVGTAIDWPGVTVETRPAFARKSTLIVAAAATRQSVLICVLGPAVVELN